MAYAKTPEGKLKKLLNDRKWNAENRDRLKLYHQRQKDKDPTAFYEYHRNYSKKWNAENREKVRAYARKTSRKYKEEYSIKQKEYREKNKDKVAAYTRRYRKESGYFERRYKEDAQYRLAYLLRRRLRNALKGNAKKGSAVTLLGCSIDELKFYLEGRFQDGMTWENWGTHGWHLDHVVPLAFFDLTNEEHLQQVCHYTNLQPLWAKENISKGARITKKVC